MSVFEKLKNALFEIEEVEVEEKPEKPSRREKIKEEKPIAKKVVLPDKRDTHIEDLHEEELIDEDFEIRPSEPVIDASPKKDFKILEDKDFRMDDDVTESSTSINVSTEPIPGEIKEEIVEVKPVEVVPVTNPVEKITREPQIYGGNATPSLRDYGTAYEKKEERKIFRPSPIISPIYGILDKNYKKEDVVPKKEVRLTSSYSKEKLDFDDVRNRAFGNMDDSSKITSTETHSYSFEVERKEPVTEPPENILVDLSDNTKKPDVKDLTMGDALEYFHDLGLEYNVDYVDATKKNETAKHEAVSPSTEVEQVSTEPDVSITPIASYQEEVSTTPDTTPSKEVDLDDTLADDNLFDLIDSMYKDSES